MLTETEFCDHCSYSMFLYRVLREGPQLSILYDPADVVRIKDSALSGGVADDTYSRTRFGIHYDPFTL